MYFVLAILNKTMQIKIKIYFLDFSKTFLDSALFKKRMTNKHKNKRNK